MISTSTSEVMNTWNFVCLNCGMKKSMKRRSSQLKTQLTEMQKESLKKFRLASYALQKVRVFWISIFPIIAPNTCQSKVSPYPKATPGVKALEKIKQLLHVNFFNKGKVLLHSCWVTREKNCTRNKILTKAFSRSHIEFTFYLLVTFSKTHVVRLVTKIWNPRCRVYRKR